VTLLGKTMAHDFEFFYQYHRFREESRQAFIDAVYGYLNGIDVRDDYIPVEFGGNVWAIGASYTIRF